MDKLSEFVNEQIKEGVSPADMKSHLMGNGWRESEVDAAINNALGKRRKSRLLFALLGIVFVGILALILVSFAKNASDKIDDSNSKILGSSTEQTLKTENTPDTCAAKEDGIEKDECYKTAIKSGFECSSLENNVEHTYCIRAYEEIHLLGVEKVDEW